MALDITQVQDFMKSLNKMYNLSLALTILSCPDSEPSQSITSKDHTTYETLETQSENGIFVDALQTVAGLFNFVIDSDTAGSEHEDSNINDCGTVVTLSLNETFSPYPMIVVFLILVSFISFNILQILRCLFHTCISKKDKTKLYDSKHNKDDNTCLPGDTAESENTNFPFSSTGRSDEKTDYVPLKMKCFTKSQQSPRQLNPKEIKTNFDVIFNCTLPKFLKEVDYLFGFEIQQMIRSSSSYANHTSPTPYGSNDLNIQSPRLRRKWSRPSEIEPSFPVKTQLDETALRSWSLFEMFCKKMSWSQVRHSLEHVNDKEEEQTEAMQIFQKFFRQNCSTKILEWNVNVLIVNYTLFLLSEVLKSTDKSNDLICFEQFESTGSAANGTYVGKPDHFDVRFVFNFSRATDLQVLHNNYCDEISPGHVVIGVKDVDNKDILHSKDYFHKGQVKNSFGNFLLCNQVEKGVDGMIRRAIKTLTADHPHRLERLPFKFKTNFNDDLLLNIDTRILHGVDLNLSSITVKFIPSLCIETSEFSLLPKLYAVPSWRMDHRRSWEGKDKKVGALTKLFLKGSSPKIPSNLFWNLSVSELERKITETMEEKFKTSQSQSCCNDCLLVLKILFSTNSKQTFLNSGEISSYVLSTVVNFLVIESSASAWTMSQLPNRVSDAIHFLRSSYTNVLLPNFIIHNPHLVEKIPALEGSSPLLSGRQQNLLADINPDLASKTLDFIESRLRGTGLSKFMKAEFSEDMWEYEFFLFG